MSEENQAPPQPSDETFALSDPEAFMEAFKKDEAARKGVPHEPATKPPPASQEPPPAEKKADPIADKLPNVPAKGVPDFKQEKAPAPPVDDEIPASIKSTKAAEDWKKLKGNLNTKEAQVRELQAEIEKFKSKPQTPQNNAELDQLKKDYELLSERLRQVAVETHPKFQAYFNEKKEKVMAALTASLGKDKAAAAANLLDLPESDFKKEKIRGMMEELDEFQQADLNAARRDMITINIEKQREIENHKANYEQFVAKEQQEREAQSNALKNAFTQALQIAKDKDQGLPVFQERDGDGEWNQGVQERIKLAENIFSGNMDAGEVAKAALWAASAPVFLAHARSLMADNQRLTEEINSLKAATPRIEGDKSEGETLPEEESTGDYRRDVERRAAKALGM